jgi:HSP20 family protein
MHRVLGRAHGALKGELNMLALWNQFDDLLHDDLFRGRRQLAQGPSFAPPVDVVETKNGFELTADLPGLTANDVDISIEDGVLSVSGERKDERVEEKGGYRRIERNFGSFKRSFALPKGIAAEQVSASFEHGQLKVFVPKPVSEVPRRVKVQPLGASSK